MYRQLCEILQKECALHHKLLEMENSKTEILVKGDVQRLDALMKSEQPVLMECSNLEGRRQELQEVSGWGETTLREIVFGCNTQEKEELIQLMGDLSSVVEQLKKVNGTNMAILTSRMETIAYINSMLGLEEKQITYQKP